MPPLVSFAVPVYNAAATLSQCVESILAQPGRDFELLLVDDGSTDESPALCDAIAARDDRVRALHKPNGGASSARNLAIDEAQGRWLLFVDADDAVCADYLSLLMERADAHPHSMFLWDSSTDAAALLPAGQTADWEAHAPARLAWLYNHDLVGAVWNTLLNVDVLRQSGLRFDTRLILGEDLPFVFQYCRELFTRYPDGDIQATRAPLYFYRESGPSSLSRQFPPNFCSGWCITFERVLEVCDGFLHPEEADLYGICYNYMRTVGVGLRALLKNPELSPAEARASARRVLQSPAVRSLCDRYRAHHWYAPFYWPFRLCWLSAIRRVGDWAEDDPARYFKSYWLGYAVHKRLHPGSPSIG